MPRPRFRFISPERQIERGHSQAAMSRSGVKSNPLARQARLAEGRAAASNLIEGTIRKNRNSQQRAAFNDGIERIVRAISGGD